MDIVSRMKIGKEILKGNSVKEENNKKRGGNENREMVHVDRFIRSKRAPSSRTP